LSPNQTKAVAATGNIIDIIEDRLIGGEQKMGRKIGKTKAIRKRVS